LFTARSRTHPNAAANFSGTGRITVDAREKEFNRKHYTLLNLWRQIRRAVNLAFIATK
jgi:hypothetical protein